MKLQRVHIQHRFRAPPDAVFEFFADHEQFGRIWPGRTRRVRDGDAETNGLGSAREICIGPICFEETTTRFERPRLLEYRVTRGGPIRDHLGHIEFHPDGDGCRIDYSIEFRGRWPLVGALVARQLPRDFKRGIARLAADIA